MSDQAFGLSANQVMAYASVANVLLVLILAAININYAWHAKRQADASLEQVAASTRQAEIGILPEDFSLAIQRANAIDQIVGENMGAASLYAGEAENNIRILRSRNPAEPHTWKEMQEKAKKNLSIAKYKLSVARTRWESMTG